MSRSVRLLCLQACFRSMLLLLLFQSQAMAAKTPDRESAVSHDALMTAAPVRVRTPPLVLPTTLPTAPVEPLPILPDSPSVEPLLPEAIDQNIRLILRRGERRVYVYEGDEVKASYPVAVGKSGWETPIGDFEIITMTPNPGWTNPFTGEVIPPGPNNPLGERWIGFWTDGTNYIGFHGTPNRNSVGRAASHGCVRMYNEHIRELYEMVELGTPVVVEP